MTNSSKETKKAYIHIVARPDILTTKFQSGLQIDVDVKPREEKEVSYIVPMIGISASDYRDYTGPWRCAVEVMEYLRIRASSIPESVFLSQKGRLWFLSKSYEDEENYKTLIAKFEFYFKENE